MKKNILILTDEIAPPAFAPRILSLCRHLHANGWECTVFSDRLPDTPAFSNADAVWYQTNFYGEKITKARYFADKVCMKREKLFQQFIERRVDVNSFSAILCSTCYYFPLRTTNRLAKKYHLPFIVDLRDIAEQWGNIQYATYSSTMPRWLYETASNIFTSINVHMRNQILRNANIVTTISTWHQELLSKYNPNTYLIYNGFDEHDFIPKDVKTDIFRICYAGKVYNTLFRDPRLAMQAASQLIQDGYIPASQIEFVFHIDTASIPAVKSLAHQYGIESICKIQGYIPREQLIELMHESSVMLVLTCLSTSEGSHGIMGTKFYEALGMEKPILCVRSDEECLEQVINQTNAGVAARDVEEAKHLLMHAFDMWKQNGFTRQAVIPEQKKRFTRSFESMQFEELLLNL